MKFLIILCVYLITFASTAFSCSTLSLSNNESVFVGRNLDWDYGHGLIIVNPRGLEKNALIGAPFTPAKWVSKFGSITFNQAGRELPYGGMNENGLDVEALWLSSAQFPEPSNQPTVNELQWVQFQLDNFSTVHEIVQNLEKIKVTKRFANLHYFACDASGVCAVLDPINGKIVVHEGRSISIAALTNSTYEDSLKYAQQFSTAKNISTIPSGTKSLSRFARLSFLLKNKSATQSLSIIDAIFSDLDNVRSLISNEDDTPTQWSIVADLGHKLIYFKTTKNSSTRTINMAKFDFACAKPARVLDINSSDSNEVTEKFVDYSQALDSDIVNKSLATGFAHLPAESIQKIINYPDKLTCKK